MKIKLTSTLILFSILLCTTLAYAAVWEVDTWVGIPTDDISLANVFTVPTASNALSYPMAVAVDAYHNLYVADTDKHRILLINPHGAISVLAGSGIAGHTIGRGTLAQFDTPTDLVMSDDNASLYVVDANNRHIKKIAIDTQDVTSVVAFTNIVPQAMTIDQWGTLYVAGTGGILYQVSTTGNKTVYAGTGILCSTSCDAQRLSARFSDDISGLLWNRANNTLYITDDNKVRMIQNDQTYTQSNTFAGPRGLSLDKEGNVWFLESDLPKLHRILAGPAGTLEVVATMSQGYRDDVLSSAKFSAPSDLAYLPGEFFVADSGNDRIRRIVDTSYKTSTPTIGSTTPTFTSTPTGSITATTTPMYFTPIATPSLPTCSTYYDAPFRAKWLGQTQGNTADNNYLVINKGQSISITAWFQNMGSDSWHNDTMRKDFIAFYVYKDRLYSTPPEYNNPYSPFFGKSYFANGAWGKSFDGTTAFSRASLLAETEVVPGDIGTFSFSFSAPTDAAVARHREDLSLAYGPCWMYNPYNGDPLNIAHVWFPIEIR